MEISDTQQIIKQKLNDANHIANIYTKDEMSFLYRNKEFYNQYIKSGKEYIHLITKGSLKNCYLICDVNGILSNWFYSPFILDGEYYNCVEQGMMAAKAASVNDSTSKTKIMKSTCPKEMKIIGKTIKMSPKQIQLWDKNKFKIVTNCVIAKFEQNERLKQWLFVVKDYIIAESSKYDRIWGIGKIKYDNYITNFDTWGNNLLGKAIMIAAIKIFKTTPSKEIEFELSRF